MANEEGPTRRGVLAAGALSVAAAPLPAIASAFPQLQISGSPGWASAADNQPIRYETYGSDGPELVFVHGWTCDRSYWNGQVAAFSGDHRVVTLDLVGHGESGRARTDWSIEGLGDDVARVARAAGMQRPILVGHSMGGPVVIEAARRLGTAVRGVVTVDILTTLQPPKGGRPPPLTAEAYLRTAPAMIRQTMFTSASDPETADRIVASMTSGVPDIAAKLSNALVRYDAAPGLVSIASTPLTMIDAGDRTIDAKGLRRRHPKTRLYTISGAGHFVMIDAPAAFNGLLRTEVNLMTGRIVSW